MIKLFPPIIVLLLGYKLISAQTKAESSDVTTQKVCQLISANPPGFHPFAFLPTVVKDKQFKNRTPKISYVVEEDGTVRDVKVVVGTGSAKLDSALVKSVQSWKYKPQPGCVISTSTVVTIDIR